MAAATYSTVADMYNFGVQMNGNCDVMASNCAELVNQFNTRYTIQDPAFPEDPTKRIWNPNIAAVCTTAQLTALSALHEHLLLDAAFWPSFMASLPTERFDVTAQLDTLCAGITALES